MFSRGEKRKEVISLLSENLRGLNCAGQSTSYFVTIQRQASLEEKSGSKKLREEFENIKHKIAF